MQDEQADGLGAQAALTLREEAAAIVAAGERLSAAALQSAIELLLACQGKVVLVGSGKSGIAARKIAGTLTSTGTASVFLHPVDALHGDLGILSPGDVAVVISNSGETDEVKSLLFHLKRRSIPVVAIVGDPASTLGRQADVVLDASVDQEVGPLSLAPTTSTTLAIVIGDALAMTVMGAKNFTVEDFASLHPAGRLGKRLTLRVADLMHSGPDNPIVSETESWMSILDRITRGGLGAVNVVASDGQLRGLITDGDVRRAIQRLGLGGLENLDAAQIMTREPVVAMPDVLAYDALRLMEDRSSQISVLPVVDKQGASVGLLRLHDIVRAGLR